MDEKMVATGLLWQWSSCASILNRLAHHLASLIGFVVEERHLRRSEDFQERFSIRQVATYKEDHLAVGGAQLRSLPR